jgi:hypothetical protein
LFPFVFVASCTKGPWCSDDAVPAGGISSLELPARVQLMIRHARKEGPALSNVACSAERRPPQVFIGLFIQSKAIGTLSFHFFQEKICGFATQSHKHTPNYNHCCHKLHNFFLGK